MAVVRHTKAVMKDKEDLIYASKINTFNDVQLFTYSIKIGENIPSATLVELLKWDQAGKILTILSAMHYKLDEGTYTSIVGRISCQDGSILSYKTPTNTIIGEDSAFVVTFLVGKE